MVKLPDKIQIEAATKRFEPYLTALGSVANAWNHLHEELGLLFCYVSGLDTTMGMNIWHSLKSDRSQRDLLDAAIKTRAEDEDWAKQFPKARESIDWMLTKIHKFAERRNDAIHAPCSIGIGDDQFEIVPHSFFGNPKAKRLRGKDILTEFDWYTDYTDALRRYAQSLQPALGTVGYSWPDKPLLP